MNEDTFFWIAIILITTIICLVSLIFFNNLLTTQCEYEVERWNYIKSVDDCSINSPMNTFYLRWFLPSVVGVISSCGLFAVLASMGGRNE
jgi:hypothetical protein